MSDLRWPLEDQGPPPGVARGPFTYRPVLLEVRERPEPVRQRWGLAAVLLALAFVTTTTMGAVWMLLASTELTVDLAAVLYPPDLPLLLRPSTVARVWTDPGLLSLGLSFSLPALAILLCHELGHYLMCRRYGLPCTLPYFLPAPLAIGTFGAFIRIRAPIRSKRELFDVGVAGPIAGFLVLVPILLLGLAWSYPVPVSELPPVPEGLVTSLLLPGDSLLLSGLTRLFHGELAAGEVLKLHPFVFAGWLGLLATSLNLIPLGQLDGGHILYAAVGRAQRRLALPLWLGLLAVAVLIWPGWLLWCLVTLVMGLYHPPVRDEEQPLDAPRRLLAWAALAIFALSFMPVPLGEALIFPGR